MSEDSKKKEVKEKSDEKPEVKKRSRMPKKLRPYRVYCNIRHFALICYLNGKPHFMSFDNTINILRQISLISIVAVGMTFVIISSELTFR